MQHIHIDGSQGEGGGQILRSSLALSLVTGKPFTIDNIRANRSKPGLMRQHLTAVRAAAEVGQCEVENATTGSVRLDFCPVKVRGGDYVFDVGTAGSATLVLQTVLPALMLADEPSTLTLRGGTHNPMAPPFEFIDRVYLPLVAPATKATLVRHGFYPAGGGEFQVAITPVKKLANVELMERGAALQRKGTILLARLPNHIAAREKKMLIQKNNWAEESIHIETVTNSAGPGNIVMLEVISENVTELFTGFGEMKVGAEAVAQRAASQRRDYLSAEVPVGQYLADQLILPLGIAAWQGSGASLFRTHNLTQHSRTHIDILQRFLEIDIKTDHVNDGQVDVCLR
jgi:RNA 3'-terminal phosphate cyclase (ATP)